MCFFIIFLEMLEICYICFLKGLISDLFAQTYQNCFFGIHIMLKHIPTYICLETVKFVSFNVKQSNYFFKIMILTALVLATDSQALKMNTDLTKSIRSMCPAQILGTRLQLTHEIQKSQADDGTRQNSPNRVSFVLIPLF